MSLEPIKDGFSHCKVKSKKRGATLCSLTIYDELSSQNSDLGLFWEFEDPNAEFHFLPATMPRGPDGKIVITGEYAGDYSLIVGLRGRKTGEYPESFSLSGSLSNSEVTLKRRFSESEAKRLVQLLKNVDIGTPDRDDSIYIERHEPTIGQRLAMIMNVLFLGAVAFFVLKGCMSDMGGGD